jgi:hypothetical protein
MRSTGSNRCVTNIVSFGASFAKEGCLDNPFTTVMCNSCWQNFYDLLKT